MAERALSPRSSADEPGTRRKPRSTGTANDERSKGQIAEFLNRKGIASPSGRAWNRTTVRNILENAVYAGECYGVKNAHPAIVSRRLWNAAQAALRRRSRG